MHYLNDNYVKEINRQKIYFSAIKTMQKEVDEFYASFKDDPNKISEWGHNYFCNYHQYRHPYLILM